MEMDVRKVDEAQAEDPRKEELDRVHEEVAKGARPHFDPFALAVDDETAEIVARTMVRTVTKEYGFEREVESLLDGPAIWLVTALLQYDVMVGKRGHADVQRILEYIELEDPYDNPDDVWPDFSHVDDPTPTSMCELMMDEAWRTGWDVNDYAYSQLQEGKKCPEAVCNYTRFNMTPEPVRTGARQKAHDVIDIYAGWGGRLE